MFGLGPRAHEVCQFSNILEIWGDPAHVNLEFGKKNKYQSKLNLAWGLKCYTHGWCEAHQTFCEFRKSSARIQGPPCPDWSPAGLHRGIQGPDFPTMLAAGRKANLTESNVCTVENSKRLPLDVVQDAYGDQYSWIYTHQDPSLVGFEFMARERTGFNCKPPSIQCKKHHNAHPKNPVKLVVLECLRGLTLWGFDHSKLAGHAISDTF